MTKSIFPIWFLWALVTIISSIIGFPLGYIIGDYVFPDRYFANHHLEIPFLFIVITVVGLVIGFGQWTILRTRLENSWMWIPATAVGLPLGILIGFWVTDSLPGSIRSIDSIDLMASFAGMFIGTLQLVALKRRFRDSFLWIIVSALGWGFGLAITRFTFETFLTNVNSWFISSPLSGISFGIIVGLFTGAFVESTLVRLRVGGTNLKKQAS